MQILAMIIAGRLGPQPYPGPFVGVIVVVVCIVAVISLIVNSKELGQINEDEKKKRCV